MKLEALQRALAGTVCGSTPADAELLSMLNGPARELTSRLDVYRRTVVSAHLRALDAAYPVIEVILGSRYWHRLLREEIGAFGSQSESLDDYGAFVPGLLRRAQPVRSELAPYPYLPELAELEWQIHTARYAADDPAFDWSGFGRLSSADRERAHPVPSHALRLLEPGHPVDVIWSRHRHQRPMAASAAGPCCVYRAGFDVGVERLDAPSAACLRGVLAGMPFSELAELGARTEPLHQLTSRVHRWIRRGWIVGFEPAS